MKRVIFLSAFFLGFSSLITQVLVIREFLSLFSGNELIIGIILSNWLLTAGIGSYFGRFFTEDKKASTCLVWTLLFLSLAPALLIISIRFLRSVNVPGLILGLHEVLGISFLSLLPYCAMSGLALALFTKISNSNEDKTSIQRVYLADSFGSVVGGMAFTFFLSEYFTPLELCTLLFAPVALSAIGVAFSEGIHLKHSIAVALLLAAVFYHLPQFERSTLQGVYPGQQILSLQNSPYGNIVVTQKEKELSVYENGEILASVNDPQNAEEIVHYALSQVKKPSRVLLISGALTGALREIQKYPVEKIDYVELDPAVLRISRSLQETSYQESINYISQDARRFLGTASTSYDAILMALPDPNSAQLNRFYTLEFFELTHKALRHGGVFAFQLSGAENYGNPALREMASSVYSALKEVFAKTIIIPGGTQFFIASDALINYDVSKNLQRLGIKTTFLTPHFIDSKLSPDRIDMARATISVLVQANTDFSPITYYAGMQYWLSHFGQGIAPICIFIALLLVLCGLLISRSPSPAYSFALSTSGFASIGLEIILLITFQIFYGSMYREIGLLVGTFMLGVAIGTLPRYIPGGAKAAALTADGLLICLPVLCIAFFSSVHSSSSQSLVAFTAPVIFLTLNFLAGLSLGIQFSSMASALPSAPNQANDVAGQLFAADFLGASIGAIAISVFCIPLLGLYKSCLLISSIKIISIIWLRNTERRVISSLTHQEMSLAPLSERTRYISLVLALAPFTIIGALVIWNESNKILYAFSFLSLYHWLLIVLVAFEILRAMGIKVFSKQLNFIYLKAMSPIENRRWFHYFAFSLVIFYPIFRCYFTVPYIFCHVCPRKCVFGYLRPYLVPAALIMNLEKRHWCHQVCPIGTFHDCQRHVMLRARQFSLPIRLIPILALVFTFIGYFKVQWDQAVQVGAKSDWYNYFFVNRFEVQGDLIFIALGLILLAFWYHRAFCNLFCPIGNFSTWTNKLGSWLFGVRARDYGK